MQRQQSVIWFSRLLMGFMLATWACSGGGSQTSVETDGGMNLELDGALDGHVGGDGAMSTDGSSTGDPDNVMIDIPVRPKTSGVINPLLVPSDVQVNADGVRRWTLNYGGVFAVGSDYPDSFELDPGIVQVAGPCGRAEGLFELTEVDAGGAMSARLDGPNRLVLENLVEGPSSVKVVGTINPTARDLEACSDVFVEGAEHRIEMRYEFSNHRPVGIELVSGSQCDEARPNTAVVTSRLARAPQILLVDEAGNTFIPRNAESGHSAALKVSAPVGTSLEDQALGIAGLRLGERAGDVVIRASFGEPLIVEVIGVERLTGWSPEFQVGAVAGTPVVLESNEAYALRGRASNRVVPMMKDLLMMDGQRVCADLSPSWFSFETLTPETCVIDREPPIESLVLFGDYFGHAAKLIADGACRLVLRAPLFDAGDGVSVELTASFSNVVNALDPSN